MQGYWEDGHFVLASTAQDKIARLEKSEASLADDVARLNSRLAAALDGLKRIAEVIEECTGKTKLPLVTQIASIAAATIARVEEEK